MHEPPVDARARLPRPRLAAARADAAPCSSLARAEPSEATEDTQGSLFDVEERAGPKPEYRLPRPGAPAPLARRAPGPNAEANARVAEALLVCLSNFGVEATIVGEITGPRVTRYELQLAPGTKVGKVAQLRDDLCYALATTEIRILAPIPGKQAVGVEVPNLSPNLVTLGDIFGDIPAHGEPARRLARQGHRRRPGLLRPRPHAAPADRRHDRLGQVGLHQHDPHLDPAALDARTRCG